NQRVHGGEQRGGRSMPMPTTRTTLLAAASVAAALALAACSSSSPGAAGARSTSPPHAGASPAPAAPVSSPKQQPVPARRNPPGDIPDTTVYVPFHADKGHITFKVPEGWARSTTSTSVTFTSTVNSITLQWMPASQAPTAQSARSKDVP